MRGLGFSAIDSLSTCKSVRQNQRLATGTGVDRSCRRQGPHHARSRDWDVHAEGGWGIAGTAFRRDEFAALAAQKE
jgi:hypothetical protein